MQKCRLLLFMMLGMFIQQVCAQSRLVSGFVTSAEDGEPLIGATVYVKGNESRGVVTDINGKYALQIDENDKVLVIAYLGMKTLELRVPKRNVINVELKPDAMKLDEVVVTGYGNFSKSSFTGSANTLKADMMKDIPVMSVEQKLQGMTTGVNITSSSGQPCQSIYTHPWYGVF